MKFEKIKPRPEPAVADREEAAEFNKRGLFIGGAAKSGTTLLMSLLDSHPQLIVVPEETTYLERRHRFRRLKTPQAKLKFLLEGTSLASLGQGTYKPNEVVAGSDVRDYAAFDYQRFVRLAQEFVSRPGVNDSLLFSETARAYGIALGSDWRNCAHWVEKTPRSEKYKDELDELFPDAKLIQIVRDPRAVFMSRKSRFVKEHGFFAEAHRLVRDWNASAREIPRLRRDPSRFLTFRYEDLVKNPREIMEKICRFAGLDFFESMLQPTRAGSGWGGNSTFHEAFQGISSASQDLWKERLTKDEIWWIELHCRKGMELAHYPLQTDAHFSLSRWLTRLPGESWKGYITARLASLCQKLGLLKDCRYNQ